jgi:hypothetical protein
MKIHPTVLVFLYADAGRTDIARLAGAFLQPSVANTPMTREVHPPSRNNETLSLIQSNEADVYTSI